MSILTLPARERRPISSEMDRRPDPVRLLRPLLRLRWLLLLGWAGVSLAGTYSSPTNEWNLTTWGGDLLFGVHRLFGVGLFPVPVNPTLPGGLHFFANYHMLQMGPIPLVMAAGLNLFGGEGGRVAVAAVIEILGLASLWLFERIALRRLSGDIEARRTWIPLTTFVGGFVFLQVWTELSGRWAHLDEALVVFFFALACWAVVNHRPALVGIALGLAVASKPWAIGLVPLVFALQGRERRRGLVWALVAVILPWAPFLIADWRTIHAGDLGIFIQPASPLTAVGFHAQPFNHASAWRLLQFALELIAVGAMVRRRTWGAALFACLAIRLVIDPMTYAYYQAAFVAGAIAFDLLVWRRPKPIATVLASLAWVTSIDIGRGSQGVPLFATYLTALVLMATAAIWFGRRASADPALS